MLQPLEFRDYSKAGLEAKGMTNRMVVDIILIAFVTFYLVASCVDVYQSVQVRGPDLCLSLSDDEVCTVVV